MTTPSVESLIRLFDATFYNTYNTRLVHAVADPEYIPANTIAGFDYHQICFAHGFFASALHEIGHWCIAGGARRLRYDFGYWYLPDGRNTDQQAAFMRVEVKPQALEWIFSKACGVSFRPSLDNLNGETADTQQFFDAVAKQAEDYCISGMPKRAALWAASCAAAFGGSDYDNVDNYDISAVSGA